MGWDPEQRLHVCNRCGAIIWMNVRQPKYVGKNGEGARYCDPYVSISRRAFFDKQEEPVKHNFMYCFDCEPILMKTLEELNKTGGKHEPHDSRNNDDGETRRRSSTLETDNDR